MGTGRDVAANAIRLDQKGGRYVWGAKGPVNFDCSGLSWKAAAMSGAVLPHGAQNQRDHCRAKGTLITVQQAIDTPGALLFRIDEGPSNDHVAPSLGNGSTCEAHSSAKGIGIFSATVGRRWTHGALIPGIQYGSTGRPPEAHIWVQLAQAIAESKKKMFRIGDVNPAIKFIQERINQISGRGLVVDGHFGTATWAAVIDLQRWFGLTVDGIVGPATWKVLYP